MIIELTSQSIREMADRIVMAYPETGKPRALEMLSTAFGYRNFDTVSGLLKKEQAGNPGFTPFTLYFAMRATTEWAPEPNWACKDITPAFVQQLQGYVAQCKESGLTSLRVDCTQVTDMCLDDWDEGTDDEPFNVHYWTLTVTPTRFWFSATPKHAEYEVETRAVYLEDLQRLIDKAPESESVSRHGNVAFATNVDVRCFVDTMLQEVWGIDQDAALEWATGFLLSSTDIESLTPNDERALCIRYHFEANQEQKHVSR